MRRRIARASGLVAVLFGLLVGSNLFTADGLEGSEWVVIGGSALLGMSGGVVFLYGLEQGRSGLRVGGWIAYALGLLLPTGLFVLQWLAIIGGLAPGFGQSHDDEGVVATGVLEVDQRQTYSSSVVMSMAASIDLATGQ